MSFSIWVAAGRIFSSWDATSSACIKAHAWRLLWSPGGEAGHGISQYVGPRQTEQIHRLRCHDQRVRRIQPAGYADHYPLRSDRAQSLHKSSDLDVVCFVTILLEPALIAGHERKAFDRPIEPYVLVQEVLPRTEYSGENFRFF